MAVFATTFTLDPDFFERDCLARFTAVSSVEEGNGTVHDLVARIELEEKLAEVPVTVLADRATRADRTSLRWDLLHGHVPGGLLHAKVAVLLWADATRLLLGSANLTPAGYRRQIELSLAADLGPRCLFPSDLLVALADELKDYLNLVPGADLVTPGIARARSALDLFRDRAISQRPARPGRRAALGVCLAPSGLGRSPLDSLKEVWDGPRPLRATHLSPFWDSHDLAVVNRVRRLLTGHGARSHQVVTVRTPEGMVPVPTAVRARVDHVYELAREDRELRALHAKCLVIESDRFVAALVGSSNHTRAGLGLNGGNSHRELNVWLGAPAGSAEGVWLMALVAPAEELADETLSVDGLDVDESDEDLPALPLGFTLCRLQRDASCWTLIMQFDPEQLPSDWTVSTASEEPLWSGADWAAEGRPRRAEFKLDEASLPAYVVVRWDGNAAPWTVLVDDPAALPNGPAIAALSLRQLLEALARGHSLSAAMREALAAQLDTHAENSVALDPLRRFDDQENLLRRGRALSKALAQLHERLSRPALHLDALQARLASPLGPRHLADKALEEVRNATLSKAEGAFTVAEVALTVGRVDWGRVCADIDVQLGMLAVERTLAHLEEVQQAVGSSGSLMTLYTKRAAKEAQRCLSN
ncbi:hypothetical protein FHX74_000519 [Friedmanniella endophytica]|uniref:PLD phosphodiesterase domain-containing protein n=1 Tax=Microlunatus kandeliicorticis TaxID=1759536 RepID=A0A7W3IPP6_9ACTN|nr:hypothetical protein [Microlunatus kandeliicorticis]MBA8792925.1 hypothetical protein [Microlunatus kandeliicorticis]